jgi:transcriptional regulator with XRE-family HTH domain
MIPDIIPFGDVLFDRRVELGLRQEDIAIAISCSTTMVAKIENGSRYPDLKTLPALADSLKIELSELSLIFLHCRSPLVYEALTTRMHQKKSSARRMRYS